MKKTPLLLLLLLIPLVIAQPVTLTSESTDATIEIEKISKGNVVITELNNPAIYEFRINNPGPEDSFQIYSLVSVSMSPKGKFVLPHGTSTIEVYAYPAQELRKNPGFLSFEYQLKGNEKGIFKDTLLINIVPIEELIEVSSQPFHPNDTEAIIQIRNTKSTNIENLKLELESRFFETETEIDLTPLEQKNISVQINKDISKLVAGPYEIKAKIDIQNETITEYGTLNYLEKEGVMVDRQTEGFIVRKTVIRKTNVGNTPVTAEVELKKDVLSRLLTLNSPMADSTERSGLSTTYLWQKTISPSETFTVSSTTNYTLPAVIIAIIIAIAFVLRFYTSSPLVINKKTSLVKTKGGEFALKINLHIKAKSNLHNIILTDTLPRMTNLYEGFGKMPDKITDDKRRVSWEIPYLRAGESRIISYIVFSKLNITGRFELPSAAATFKKDNETMHSFSNRAFHISEMRE